MVGIAHASLLMVVNQVQGAEQVQEFIGLQTVCRVVRTEVGYFFTNKGLVEQ